MSQGPFSCRRRRKRRRPSIGSRDGEDTLPNATPFQLHEMAPRSFEHQLSITVWRTGHRLAFLSRGLLSYFMTHLEGISNFCAIYSLTGLLFTAFVGSMIKHQPLFIKGINEDNQEHTKESAFGAMGMFIFVFSSSVIYLCMHRHHDDEHAIRAQGYMRPHMQAGGMRLSDYQVELPHSESSPQIADANDSDDDEYTPALT